jgi:hypothetical protein
MATINLVGIAGKAAKRARILVSASGVRKPGLDKLPPPLR